MKLANESAELVLRVLHKCSDEVEPAGPWRWLCTVQNGKRLPITAAYGEGFLHLACWPEGSQPGACTLEDAVLGNNLLTGGVKVVVDGSSGRLHLQSDIVVAEESQLLDRFWWALDGFHDGCQLLLSPASGLSCEISGPAACGAELSELLRETSWALTERGPSEFSVEIDKDSLTTADIQMNKSGMALTVELVRANGLAEATRRALALFLLTVSAGLRFVRCYGTESDGGWTFGMQVSLPAKPKTEEIDHALAALTIARRQCARETCVLLDDAAARCYLAARTTSTTNDHQKEKEN